MVITLNALFLVDTALRLKVKAGDVAQKLCGADLDRAVEKALDEPIEKAWETVDSVVSVARKAKELAASISVLM